MYSSIVSVIANPQEITNFKDLTYMQEMTARICELTPEHTDHQLIDQRDGQKYFVTKMKDGNCWMTQNLALDIKTSGVVAYNANTKSTFTWSGVGDGTNNLPKGTETSVPGAISGGGPQNDTRSWNLGKKVISGSSQVDVSGFEPTFKATNASTTYDATAKTYDPHYLIGNYYQYNTATAGTGAAVSTDGANATSSICPAGWVLPLSGTTNNNTSGSFYNMLSKYNAANNDATSSGIIVQPPLSFVRSGDIELSNGYVYSVGSAGFSWSRVSKSTTTVYYLGSNSTGVNLLGNGDRLYGLPLRCLYVV